MFKKLLPFFLILFIACEKEDTKSPIDYRIAFHYSANDYFYDSLNYYYDNNNKLIGVEKFRDNKTHMNFPIDYQEDYIRGWNGRYISNDNNQIIKIDNSSYYTEIEYEGDKIVCRRQIQRDFMKQEIFYFYQDDNIIRDSTILYHHDSEPTASVSLYEYYDILTPDFMVDYSGFFQIPIQSKNLIKHSSSIGYESYNEYEYEISDNEIIITGRQYNEDNSLHHTSKTIYRKEEYVEDNN